jgi:transposase
VPGLPPFVAAAASRRPRRCRSALNCAIEVAIGPVAKFGLPDFWCLCWQNGFMARQFKPVDRDQPMMLPEDMHLWVGKDHLVWFVIDVVGGLDTAGLERLGKPGRGRPGYDPRMLAVLLVYAYLQGVRSSRRIEERCRTDAAFRVATGNQVPDHATIARFRAAAAGEGGPLEDLFLQVLFVLAVAGLGRLDVVSVDGSKIWANASKQANRTEGGLRKLARKVLDDAARSDGAGCGCRGHGHGDAAGLPGPDSCSCCDGGMLPGLGLDGPAVPAGGWGSASRAQRIAAGLQGLQAVRLEREAERRRAAEAYLAASRDGRAPMGGIPAGIAAEAARLRLERAIAGQQAAEASREQAGRRKPGPRHAGEGYKVRRARERLAALTARKDKEEGEAARARGDGKKKDPEPVRNITDPDSRVMHCTLRGKVQAYNGQARRTRDGLFLLPRVTQDPNDAFQVQTAIEDIEASRAVIAAGHAAAGLPSAWSRTGTILSGNGFFSKDNIELPGPDRLIGTGNWKDPGPHGPGCRHEDPRDQMHHNLATRQGQDLYRNRAPVSEGGFADLKERTGLRQFSMRGLPKAGGELLLGMLACNIHLGWRRGISLA